MDINRLANVIFERAEKISESTYNSICEAIEKDMFSLNEHVLDYKQRDAIFGKLFFVLEDGSKVLISKEILESINSLNIDGKKIEAYMRRSFSNLTKMLETLNGDQ